MKRPDFYLRLDSISIWSVGSTTLVDSPTLGSWGWQGEKDITTCGPLIATAFVLGFWEILEDEIMVAVWGTSKEVKVLANLDIDIGGK